MPDATITSTESTFGTITGTFAADQSTVTGTITGIITGTLTGSVGVPGPAGAQGPAGPAGPPGPPGPGSSWGTITGTLSNQSDLQNALDAKQSVSGMSAYLTKADNLGSLTNFSTARDNLGLGALYTPVFAGITAQGSGANLANYDSTFLTINQVGHGQFTIQPSQGIVFPDTTVQTTAFTGWNNVILTGDPQAPTAALGDNDQSLATTAFVQQELASGVAVAKNLEVYVRNQSGSTIPAGSIVYISGATGNRPLITLAQANNDANSAQTMGFTKTAIANNGFGFVIVRGELENIDTSALTEGAQLYLSPTVAGTWTTTKPSAPQHLVYVGIVVRAHPTQGIILVAVQNGYELNELHDVAITSPTNGQVLKYNSSTNLWVNDTDVGGVAWGGITGTLSDQTDLQNALNAKLEALNPSAVGDLTITGAFTLLTASSGVLKYTHTTLPEETRLRHDSFTLYADGSIDDKMVEISMTGITLYDPGVPGSGATIVFPDGTTQTTAFQGLGGVALLSGATFSGKVNFTPSATSAGLNIGTIATTPTTLSSGDLWIGDNLNYRNQSGATRTVINAQTANTITVTGANAPLTLNQNGTGSTFLVNAAVASTSPAVKITNNGTGDSLQIDNGTPDVAFTVNADGRVGVGTAPDATAAIKLDAGGIKFNDGTTQTTAPIADAPSDGTVYGRQNGSWVNAETDQVNVQTFGGPSSSGTFTWTKPVGAKWVEVLMIGAGGGGGSGARYATSTARYGGGGGGGGSVLFVRIHADDLASTETVTVGAGGQGGEATTINSQPGTAGTNGGDSFFGPYFASGGPGGNRGTTAAAANTGNRFFMLYCFSGSTSNGGASSGQPSNTLLYQYQMAPGGGGGGGYAFASSTADINGGAGGGKQAGGPTQLGLISAVSGGAGGIASSSTPPTNGVATSGLAGGTGGGGGYYKTAVVGSAGGNGAFPGGGGGGGGASDNGFNSGAGGNGGNAFIVITTYCV